MPEREPATQTIEASAVRQQWSQLLKRVFDREARVIVEDQGIPVAALISAADLERLRGLEAQREERFGIVDELRARNQDVDPDEVEHDVAKEIAAMRAEARRPREE
jgi:prevent-host-death family protein